MTSRENFIEALKNGNNESVKNALLDAYISQSVKNALESWSGYRVDDIEEYGGDLSVVFYGSDIPTRQGLSPREFRNWSLFGRDYELLGGGTVSGYNSHNIVIPLEDVASILEEEWQSSETETQPQQPSQEEPPKETISPTQKVILGVTALAVVVLLR